MKKFAILAVLAAAAFATGCARIESGHSGIRVNFNGSYDPQELGVGYHQNLIGGVKVYVTNEMTMQLNDLKPQTRDKTVMHDMDLQYTFSINPAQLVELETAYKGRDLDDGKGNVYPMALYVNSVVQTAVVDVISKYDALDVNDHREEIRQHVLDQATAMLKQEKLDGAITVKQLFIKNMQIAPALTQSALAAIAAENELKAKKVQVQVAQAEAERAKALSGSQNLEYMKVQAELNISEAIKAGNVQTIIIPSNLTMLGGIGK